MSVLGSFQFGYGYGMNSLTGEQIEALKGLIPDLVVDEKGQVNHWKEYRCDLRKLYEILPGAKIELTGVQDNIPELLVGLAAQLQTVAERLGSRYDQGQEFNRRVQVHVPGLGLLLVDEVTILTDVCTDVLQESLDQGWRILAVCPQPDQRRPDYVVGRTPQGRGDR